MGLLSIIKPLAYLSLPVFLLRTLSQASPIARYYVRLGVYLSAISICSAWGAIISLPMTLAGRRFDINWVVARTFYLLAGKSLGITIEVEGEEHLHTCPAIFVGNHQSMLDVLYLGRYAASLGSLFHHCIHYDLRFQGVAEAYVYNGKERAAMDAYSWSIYVSFWSCLCRPGQ